MLPTFTTNSINILAGINGVEVIQGFIIALSVLLNDMLYLPVWPQAFLEYWSIPNPEEGRLLDWAAGEVVQRHLMSAYFMAPLVGVCAGFLWHNWYVPDLTIVVFLLKDTGTPQERFQGIHSVISPEWHFRQLPFKVISQRL